MPRRNSKFRCGEFSISWGFSKPVKKVIALMGEAAFVQITLATANSLTVLCSCVPTGESHHQLWQPQELVSRECTSASDPALEDSFPVHMGLPSTLVTHFLHAKEKVLNAKRSTQRCGAFWQLPAFHLRICRPLCHMLFSHGTLWQADTA